MVIYRRRVFTQKLCEDVCAVIQTSAYFGTCQFEGNSFSVRCAKRSHRGQIMLIPVKGDLICCDDGTYVNLELHASLEMYLGFAVILLGLLRMLLKLLFPVVGWWIDGILTMGIGALIAIFSWLRGIEIVDLLEHKLTR